MSFLSTKLSQTDPEDLKTVSEGIPEDLKPNSLQDLGNFLSQVIAKYAHRMQSAVFF